MSLPSKRIIIPVGVTVKKNIIPMIIGETIAPRNEPSLNHNLFGRINALGKKIAKKKKDECYNTSPKMHIFSKP